MKPSLPVKTLQVRQQGGLRELHRFWCWPRRSSHGRDHFGYRPCTLAPRPAPKSITALPEIDSRCSSSYFFSGNRTAKFPKKFNEPARSGIERLIEPWLQPFTDH